VASTETGPKEHGVGSPGPADTILGLLVFLAILLHPTQVTVRQWADLFVRASGFGVEMAGRVPAVNVTVSDGLLGLAFLLWLVLVAVRRRLREQVACYPGAAVAMLACGALSALPFVRATDMGRPDVRAAVRELVQLAVFFVCAYGVLADLLRRATWRRRLTAAFVCGALVVMAAGLWEYARLRPGDVEAAKAGAVISPTEVDATFGLRSGQSADPDNKMMIATASNRSVLGAWLTVALPLLWGVALSSCCPAVRIVCGVATAAGMPLLLQGGLWAAALLGVLVVSFARGRWHFLATAAGLAALWAAVFTLAPQRHGQVLVDSVMLRREVDRFYTLRLYEDNASAWVLKRLDAGQDARPLDLAYPGYDSPWQQRFAEWQAGLQALARSPLLGVGLGSYQDVINGFYERPPDPDLNPGQCYNIAKKRGVNLMEFGGNSTCLVWLVSTGLVGLAALVWLLLFGLGGATRAVGASLEGLDYGLALGALGALVGAAGGMLFTEYLVRGVGVALVFVLALAAALGSASDEGRRELAAGVDDGLQ